ncbi:hypothetical protein BGZ58_001349 [Dissophora ornata]|nr:hypothetical protein BGZ58_001349 [Dissophora ornata]
MENKTSDPGQTPLDKTGTAESSRSAAAGPDPSNANQQPSNVSKHVSITSEPSTSSAVKRKQPPYDWQLLPQEELERIAYNSRKQQNARLKSRKHSKRVEKQRERDQKLQQDFKSSETSGPSVVDPSTAPDPAGPAQDVVMKDPIGQRAIAGQTEMHALEIENAFIKEKANLGIAVATNSKSAKQRRRKVERDRKKARALTEKELAQDHCMPSAPGGIREDEGPSNASALEADRDDGIAEAHITLDQDESVLAAETDHGIAGSFLDDTTLGSVTNNSTQGHWYCSVCRSSWKRKVAWQGHLVSAQHLRHVVRVMQQLAPPIAPYGKKDVLAAMDPFGWGTGTGVVEEEEEEDEEEEEEEEKKEEREEERISAKGTDRTEAEDTQKSPILTKSRGDGEVAGVTDGEGDDMDTGE